MYGCGETPRDCAGVALSLIIEHEPTIRTENHLSFVFVTTHLLIFIVTEVGKGAEPELPIKESIGPLLLVVILVKAVTHNGRMAQNQMFGAEIRGQTECFPRFRDAHVLYTARIIGSSSSVSARSVARPIHSRRT